jgi:streptomycin 6-kinase
VARAPSRDASQPPGTLALSRRLERRVALFSETLGFEAKELAAWGFVHGVLSACWSLEDHSRGHEAALAVAARLERLQ